MKLLHALLLALGVTATAVPALAGGWDEWRESEHRKFDPDRDMQGRRFHPDHDRGTVSRDSWLRRHGFTDFGIPPDRYPRAAAWLPRQAYPEHASAVVIDLRQPGFIQVTGDIEIITDGFVREKMR